jgi:hypothetical protein
MGHHGTFLINFIAKMKMPNLDSLIQRGSRAFLNTFKPKVAFDKVKYVNDKAENYNVGRGYTLLMAISRSPLYIHK